MIVFIYSSNFFFSFDSFLMSFLFETSVLLFLSLFSKRIRHNVVQRNRKGNAVVDKAARGGETVLKHLKYI